MAAIQIWNAYITETIGDSGVRPNVIEGGRENRLVKLFRLV